MSDAHPPPVEHAPVLRLYGDHAARVARLCRLRPALLARIVFAPRAATHALGAFLHLAPGAAQPDADLAHHLERTDPPALLQQAIPDAPSALYGALDRAGESVQPKAFYETIGNLCRGPLRDWLLRARHLDPATVRRLEAVRAMDPAVAQLGPAIIRTPLVAEYVDHLAGVLRAFGALSGRDLHLPPNAGLPELRGRFLSAVDRLQAPDPGFSLPAPYRIVRSVAELRAISARTRQWPSAISILDTPHWHRLATGGAVYVACDSPSMLVTVAPAAPGLWHGSETHWLQHPVAEALRDGLAAAFRDAGQRVLWADPVEILGLLQREADD